MAPSSTRQPSKPLSFIAAPALSARFAAKALTVVACLAIITVGAAIRIIGTDWDEGANLHPDERHMVFVVMDTMRAFDEFKPGELSLSDNWFAAGKSPLDPRRKGQLYVYGELPHLVVSVVSRFFDPGWPQILLRARTIGSVIDAYTILAVFLLAVRIVRNFAAALAAATLYAFLPMAIQQANFFTVDVWLIAATAWCLLAATMIVTAPGKLAPLAWAAVAGCAAGIAAACKLPGLALVGGVCVALGTRFVIDAEFRRLARFVPALVLALGAAAITLRLCSPFTFQGPGFFGLTPTESFIKGYQEMGNLVLDFGFPPNWQWLGGYGRVDALRDLAVWGLGLPTTLAVLAGAALACRRSAIWARLLPSLVVLVAFLVYWLSVPNPALRYMSPALPVLCVLSAVAFAWLFARRWTSAVAVLVIAAAGVWGYGMVTLHTTSNNRVVASRWLWLNSQPGTVLLNETNWDDGLPVPVRLPGAKDLAWAGQGDHFSYLVLGLEAPDSDEKARQIAKLLDDANLLIISSERMRRPIRELSDRFPMSAAYYALLASGALCFEPIFRTPTGYPVAGMRIDDSWAQEPWSVYDHPTVEIYRRLSCYDRSRTEQALLRALR